MRPDIIRGIALTLLVTLALICVVFGFRAGQRRAQAEFTINQVEQITLALAKFYADQERYPNGQEFMDKNAFGKYLTTFPLPEKITSPCIRPIEYSVNVLSRYTIDFCLAGPVKSYTAGQWQVDELGHPQQKSRF